jgi:VIT1/CCC1 family predicted Fe2+/Mn2+ transporter
VTGIAAGTKDADIVLLSGLVIVVVESISMAAGSYLSLKSEYELMGTSSRMYSPLKAGVVMLFFYLLGGIIPLLPYAFLDLKYALYVAVVCGGMALFALGYWKGKVVQRPPLKSALEMMGVSLVAATAGYAIGEFAPDIIQLLR